MEYGKLIDNNLQLAPNSLFLKDGGVIWNPTKEQLIDNGFKEVIYATQPTLAENEYLEESYTDTGSYIAVTYEIKTAIQSSEALLKAPNSGNWFTKLFKK